MKVRDTGDFGLVHLRRNFLAPFDLVTVLDAIDHLAGAWTASDALGLLGRGGTSQIRPSTPGVRSRLDVIRETLAPATLAFARSCGFPLAGPRHLALFPVKMVGDENAPAYQEPHTDSNATQPGAPVCTNVFYARTRDVVGGDLRVGGGAGREEADPVVVRPTANTLVSFAGERVHWVEPLWRGERLSVVINFY